MNGVIPRAPWQTAAQTLALNSSKVGKSAFRVVESGEGDVQLVAFKDALEVCVYSLGIERLYLVVRFFVSVFVPDSYVDSH